MKKYCFIFFIITLICFGSSICFAQNQQKIDSLRKHLPFRIDDSLKVSGYADLSWYYITNGQNLDSARVYSDTIKMLSERINHPYGIVLSDFYYGVINRYEGEYRQGINHMNEFVNYHRQKGDSSRVAAGLYQIGVMQTNLGNYEKGLSTYQGTLNIYKQNKNTMRIAQMLHSMAHIQRKIGKHGKAIESYKEAMKVWKELGNISALSMSSESLGNTYGELKQYDKAERYLLEALAIVNDEQRPIGIASVTENLGNLYDGMGDYSESLKYHLQSLKIREKLSSKKNLALSLTKVGNLYNKLGKPKLAEDYLIKSLKIAKGNDIKPVLEQNYKALSDFYISKKDFNSALKYQQLYIGVKDSILSTEKSRQLLEIETKYETAEKEHQIALLNKENQLKEAENSRQKTIKTYLIGVIALLGILALLVANTFRQRLKNQKIIASKDKELRLAKHREQLKILETKALRAQMNPHFLFNSLNSINTMILNEENENASKYLSKFSKLVRLMLENSEQPEVILKDELDMLKTYIELEMLRFNDKIEYSIDVEKSIDQESIQIPSMLLQPFVENAIWHGLMTKEGFGYVKIKIEDDKDNLNCSIIDNGIGREASLKLSKEESSKKKSMGIKITADRLKMLTEQKIKDAVKIIDLKDAHNNALGTQVTIQIPIT